MKSVYLILTCSNTIISRVIRRFTGENYTHAAIAFDDDLHIMYSFARKYASLPLPAGFMEEHTDGKFYRLQGNIPCIVMRKNVSLREYYMLKGMIRGIQCRSDEYKYSLFGLILCRLGIPLEIPGRFFCSQFVAWLLEKNNLVSLPKPSSLMHPADFLSIGGFETVYRGGLTEWNDIAGTEDVCLPELTAV